MLAIHVIVAPGSGTNANGSSSGSPLNNRTGSPPDPNGAAAQQSQGAGGTGQSPMAALMSVADNLPPGSPRSAGGSPPSSGAPRSASRGSQHSPNSTGELFNSLVQLIIIYCNFKIL